MRKLFVFDIGGVIISKEVEKIDSYIADYLHIDEPDYIVFLHPYKKKLTKGQTTLLAVYTAAIKHFGVSNKTSEEVVQKHLKLFREVIVKLNTDILDLINLLKLSYKVVCLVNAEREVVPLVRKRGIYDFFVKTYISCEIGMQKPELSVYTAVLEDMGYLPNETVFIDDKLENVMAAKKLGINAFVYESYKKLCTDLNEYL
jgi:HAD superfamily hydrolase (TIGR01509 family)